MARLIGAMTTPVQGLLHGHDRELADGAADPPAVTFGQGPFAAIGHRARTSFDALKGPLGIALVVVLVILFFWPRIRAARARRASYRDKY